MMMKSKFMKVLVVSAFFVTFSSTAAFAAEVGGQNTASQGKVEISNRLYEKQQEIDKYLFEEHAKEIANLGFKVTHTAVMDNQVEIGITPYNDTNADYLYDAFGKEAVNVVEGEQAVILKSEAVNMQAADTGVANAAAAGPDASMAEDKVKVYKDADASVGEDAVLYDTAIAETDAAVQNTDASKAAEMQITSENTSGSDNNAQDPEVLAYASGAAADTKPASKPYVPAVLAGAAGAAVIIGGTVVWIRFRKSAKNSAIRR